MNEVHLEGVLPLLVVLEGLHGVVRVLLGVALRLEVEVGDAGGRRRRPGGRRNVKRLCETYLTH